MLVSLYYAFSPGVSSSSEDDATAQAIFGISGWPSWCWTIALASGRWRNSGRSRGALPALFRPRDARRVGILRTPLVKRCLPFDRLPYPNPQPSCMPREPGNCIFLVSAAVIESLRIETGPCADYWHRRRHRSSWPRRFLARCPPFRVERDRHSSGLPSAARVSAFLSALGSPLPIALVAG